jgi:hypothetical protein
MANETKQAALLEVVSGFLRWAAQKCPCENEQPNPCPLCGASVENLDACKAADSTLPSGLLEKARAAINAATGSEVTGDGSGEALPPVSQEERWMPCSSCHTPDLCDEHGCADAEMARDLAAATPTP